MNTKDTIQADKITASWRMLNKYIKHLSEEQLRYAIGKEYARSPMRTTVLNRLKQRVGALAAKSAKEKVTK